MYISFDTDELSPTDIAMLAVLVKGAPDISTDELRITAPAERGAPAKAASPTPAKAKPAAPAKEKPVEAEAKPVEAKAKPAAPAPKETPAADDAPATAVPPADDTLQEAIKLASQLISQGKTAAVKAALTSAGVARVSELTGPAIASFMTELNDA